MRVKTPYIEALRKQQKDVVDTPKKCGELSKPLDRDLSPKKMSDSYYKVVRYFSEITSYISSLANDFLGPATCTRSVALRQLS